MAVTRIRLPPLPQGRAKIFLRAALYQEVLLRAAPDAARPHGVRRRKVGGTASSSQKQKVRRPTGSERQLATLHRGENRPGVTAENLLRSWSCGSTTWSTGWLAPRAAARHFWHRGNSSQRRRQHLVVQLKPGDKVEVASRRAREAGQVAQETLPLGQAPERVDRRSRHLAGPRGAAIRDQMPLDSTAARGRYYRGNDFMIELEMSADRARRGSRQYESTRRAPSGGYGSPSATTRGTMSSLEGTLVTSIQTVTSTRVSTIGRQGRRHPDVLNAEVGLRATRRTPSARLIKSGAGAVTADMPEWPCRDPATRTSS